MKFYTIISIILTLVAAQELVILTRPDDEKVNIGPGPGCFNIEGLVKGIDVPLGQSVAFHAVYDCMDISIYSGGSTLFSQPMSFSSIYINTLEQLLTQIDLV